VTDVPPPPSAQTSDLEEVLSRPAMHSRDRVPGWILRAYGRFTEIAPYNRRAVIAVVIVALAVGGAILLSSTRLVRNVIDALDILSFVGLFLVNWVGNGGVLVPVPGARFLGLLMIFQHAAIFATWEVFLVSGAAMGLGMVSYYIAGARSADAYERGDTEAAAQVLSDATSPEDDAELDPTGDNSSAPSRRARMRTRFEGSWSSAQARARPIIEKRGLPGMFWLCFVPSPAATAAAFLGGAMRFGFTRFLLAAFSSKFLLAGVIVIAGLIFNQQASSVDLPG
jgi:hypothetical protein